MPDAANIILLHWDLNVTCSYRNPIEQCTWPSAILQHIGDTGRVNQGGWVDQCGSGFISHTTLASTPRDNVHMMMMMNTE